MHLPANSGIGTLLSHFGEESKPHGSVVPPIYQNSLFVFDKMDELISAMTQRLDGPDHHYSRISNPSVEVAERKLAVLEGADKAKAFGTGMSAITNAILSTVASGSHVVTLDTAYGPVRQLLRDYLPRFGVSHCLVGGVNTDEVIDAIRPETTCLYLESPSSLLFRMQDIARIATAAKEKGVTTIIDNTYNTPLHFQPHSVGIDLVCHSATKYLNGHSDITGGFVSGNASRMEKFLREEVALIGGLMAPFPAWLLTRGLRTLKVRLKAHEATANTVASWLEARPEVERVHHLGLDSFAQRELVRSQLKGTGGLFSFEPKFQTQQEVYRFCDALQIFQRGISWGGHESLVVAAHVQPSDYSQPRWIIRLFCGLEEPEDLVADLAQAFSSSA